MTPLPHLVPSLHGASAFITGAGSGMGRATAIIFSREGAKVAVVDRNAEAAQAVAREIEGEGGAAVAIALDLAKFVEIAPAVEDIAARFGGLEIVVNNAGISAQSAIRPAAGDPSCPTVPAAVCSSAHPEHRLDRRPWRDFAAERLQRRQSWRSRPKPFIGGGPGPEGITVNCISPGSIEISMTDETPGEDKAVMPSAAPHCAVTASPRR